MKFLIKYFFIFAPVISVVLMLFISIFMTFPSCDVRFASVLAAASILFLGLYIFPFKKTRVDTVGKRLMGTLFFLLAIITLGSRRQEMLQIVLIVFSSIVIILFFFGMYTKKSKEKSMGSVS